LKNNKERFLPIGFVPLVPKLGDGSLMNPIYFAKTYKLFYEGFDYKAMKVPSSMLTWKMSQKYLGLSSTRMGTITRFKCTPSKKD
jgi:hypothetical protein